MAINRSPSPVIALNTVKVILPLIASTLLRDPIVSYAYLIFQTKEFFLDFFKVFLPNTNSLSASLIQITFFITLHIYIIVGEYLPKFTFFRGTHKSILLRGNIICRFTYFLHKLKDLLKSLQIHEY